MSLSKLCTLFIHIIVLTSFFLVTNAHASNERVLFISSHHPGFSTFSPQLNGLQSILSKNGIHLDVEFLDSDKIASPQPVEMFTNYLDSILRTLPRYDVVIASGDAALSFVHMHHSRLFHDIPLVFCDVKDVELGYRLGASPMVTGVMENYSLQETLDVISHLLPHASSINLIVDPNMWYAFNGISQIRSLAGPPISILSLDSLDWSEVERKLMTLTKNDPVVLLSAQRDSSGVTKSRKESLQFVISNTNAPVFQIGDLDIGTGAFGRTVTDHFQQSQIAAKMTVEILNGRQVDDMPVMIKNTVDRYVFNHAVLKKFNISEQSLPPHSTIINKPSSLAANLYGMAKTKEVKRMAILVLLGLLLYFVRIIHKKKTINSRYRQQFQAVYDCVTSGIAILDPHGHFLYANKYLCDTLGYEEKDLVGCSLRQVVHKEDFLSIDNFAQELLDTQNRFFLGGKRYITKNGDTRWADMSFSAVTDTKEIPQYYIAVFHDITNRKTIEAIKNSRLELMRASMSLDMDQLLVRVLDTVEHLVGCDTASFSHVDTTTRCISLKACSDNTMKLLGKSDINDCQDYASLKADFWDECLRSGKPVFWQDRTRQESETQILNELVIPVYSNADIVAILSVGNRSGKPFSNDDVNTLTIFFDFIVGIIRQKKTYDELKSSEKKFSRIFDLSPVMVSLSKASDSTFININKAFSNVFGFSKKEALGKTSLELGWIKPNVRNNLIEHLNKYGSVKDLQLVLYGKGNTQIECVLNGEIIRLNDEDYLLLIAQDMTTFLENEKVIRESRAKYRQLFNGGGDIVFVHPFNPDMVKSFTEVNEIACSRLGYSSEELRQRSLQEIVCTDQTTLNQSEAARSELLESGYCLYESKYKPKVGAPFPVEVSSRVFKVSGKPYVLSIARDITERKAAKKERRRLRQDYRELFTKMQEGVAIHEVVYDESGVPVDHRFIEVNPAFEVVTGFKPHEVVGKTVLEVFPNSSQSLIATFAEVAMSGTLTSFEKHLEATKKHVIVKVFQNAPKQFACIFTDITAQKESEERLRGAMRMAEAANRIKSDFMANMSHEIRTPLNGIMGMLQLMDGTLLSGEQQEFIHAATVSSKRLTKLLCDILDHSRIEAGRLSLESEHFNLHESLEHLKELFQVTARQKNLNFSLSIDERIPSALEGDVDRLNQVLSNLLGNAMKFTSEGSVDIEAYRLPDYRGACHILFKVSDTGIGIEDDTIDLLFSPFTQASGGYTRKFEGVGLGLSICKQIVQLMKGSICLVSTHGKGTDFYVNICFPFVDEQPVAITESNIPQLSQYNTKRILVAEDDEINSFAIQKLLTRTGATVHCVTNGQMILDILEAEDFDLILMDIQMPIMNGIEATKSIRSGTIGRDKADIPIIALTAYAMVKDKQEFIEAGMDDYVVKPIEQEKLFMAIDRCFGNDKRNG